MSDNRFFLENDKMTNDNLDNVTLEVEWCYATIRKRLCDYSRGAMRVVGWREADFYAFMDVCMGLFECCGKMVVYSR